MTVAVTEKSRCRLLVGGTVQGVGFRPFVYRTAQTLGLTGQVGNTERGVVVEVEGRPEDIRTFMERLRTDAPPLARVNDVHEEWIAPTGQTRFEIVESKGVGGAATIIPPDVATCPSCLKEMEDAKDRRAGYPFINCTDCGPRFTIIEGVPYDRARTTMRDFQLCAECRAEYEDPGTRRFHAEPNACPRCGPRVWLSTVEGQEIMHQWPVMETARLLRDGNIVAIKGMGGFHLACDANNAAQVQRLRQLKQRDRKPFAVMVADVESLTGLVAVHPEEMQLLRSPARPIVLLSKADAYSLAEEVAPGISVLGVMLPYTPLHHLLMRTCVALWPSGKTSVLVMTSANPGGEPIVRENAEALERLGDIADVFLMHDRRILARTDDSVVMHQGKLRMVRRSRGYTPEPVPLPVDGPPVLAVGGDLKNAYCITRGKEAFFGPHVGDMENVATSAYFVESVTHLCKLLEVRPQVVAHDTHPDYSSTRLARRMAREALGQARLVEVQHHHAHVLSCLAENGLTGPALGLALDGMGHGTDGTSWGGELLLVDGVRFQRMAHLSALPLPGGDKAVQEPWRMALAALVEGGGLDLARALAARWTPVHGDKVQAVLSMAERGAPFPRSSSLGRLFDVVSAIAGVRAESSYEGEAAVALEHAARRMPDEAPAYPVSGVGTSGGVIIDTKGMIREIARDALAGMDASRIAARFHASVAKALVSTTEEVAGCLAMRTVALTGGAMQNRILFDKLSAGLTAARFNVLTHGMVPANDGGLALGQALAALLTVRGQGSGGRA